MQSAFGPSKTGEYRITKVFSIRLQYGWEFVQIIPKCPETRAIGEKNDRRLLEKRIEE